MSTPRPVDHFCGCCGREVDGPNLWCGDCSPHVVDGHAPPWERTWSAVHGEACPFAPRDIFKAEQLGTWSDE